MLPRNTAQQIRETIGDPRCDEWITKWIAEIENDFVKHDIECVMEHPNDALRIAIGIGGMRIVDKELDMMDGYEFMKVINGCSTDNDKISKV